MGSSLTLLCNSWRFVSDISFSYSYLYWYDLYLAVSHIYFMISLCAYSMSDTISQLAYTDICSSIHMFALV